MRARPSARAAFLWLRAPERTGTTTLAEISAPLARDEPRVVDLVTGLAPLATLALYFRDTARRATDAAPSYSNPNAAAPRRSHVRRDASSCSSLVNSWPPGFSAPRLPAASCASAQGAP